MGIIVNHELTFTEIRMRQLAMFVDVFVIMESKMTSGGDTKPLHFYEAFKKGFLHEFQDKILYICIEEIPSSYIKDGWLAESFLRNEMSQRALSRLKGLKEDDLFLSFDADEIPKEEVIIFLKFHTGYKIPFMFNFRWSVFTFYWIHSDDLKTMTSVIGGSTIKHVAEKCLGNIYDLRNQKCVDTSPLEVNSLATMFLNLFLLILEMICSLY